MTSTSGAVEKSLSGLARATVAVAGGCLVAMALVQFWQVFARYVLNSSPGWTEPVALLFMSFAVMLGAAVAVRRESHFGFFTVRDMTPARVQAALKAVSRAIALATGLALLVWGGQLMLDDWSVPMAGAPLPAGFRYLPLFSGGALMALFAAERLFTGDPPDDHQRTPADDAPEA
jgi:TRAP-type C4-dicarboxylate transport system permease small subunit